MLSQYELFFRGVDDARKVKLMKATDAVIDLLRSKLKLERWECLLVIKTLYDCFPVEDLFKPEAYT